MMKKKVRPRTIFIFIRSISKYRIIIYLKKIAFEVVELKRCIVISSWFLLLRFRMFVVELLESNVKF